MINLLPPSYADAIRYGRQNSVLRRWLIGTAIAIGGLIVIIASGWLYINQQANGLQKNIDATNQQLQAQNLAKVQKDAKEITGDVNVIDKLLSQEIRFSELIQAIGDIMPPGTSLGTLSLSNVVAGGVDLTANAADGASVAQIAANLSDPKNQLFTKADIVSVNCDNNPNQAYPCTVILRVLFSPSAQTRFLSVPSGDKQ
ncbi:MAG TPA: hypothetical protein VFJ84_01955 [Candidatus Saccharimonadales bacterium]|nr:hypothetical protein [Candidatus Saccharimonadales bacterium]